MHIYAHETPLESKGEGKYISIRCPHVNMRGYVCGRLLLRFTGEDNAEMEIKCPKCKNVIRVNVVR